MAMSDSVAGGPASLPTMPTTHVAGAALAALFASLLIGSECVAIAGATAWAVASSFHIAGMALTALEGFAVAASLVATAIFARKAYRSERMFRSSPHSL